MQDDDDCGEYHTTGGLVYAGNWALEIVAIWDGVQAAEHARIPLSQISRALSHNWPACVVPLARKNIAVLRALIHEAGLP
jgi:hypothetical protein